MIEIRPLNMNELKDAIDLKVKCWTEELAGVSENTLDSHEELNFFTSWARSEKENADRRILLGAFSGDKLEGAAFGSFAEEYDGVNAMELNGLWIEESFRGQGIALLLLKELTDAYMSMGRESMVVYNHHLAPSNAFYHKLHGQVVRQERQMDGHLLIDIFKLDLQELSGVIDEKLRGYR